MEQTKILKTSDLELTKDLAKPNLERTTTSKNMGPKKCRTPRHPLLDEPPGEAHSFHSK